MARPQFTVQPQRSNGFAYIPCEIQRATSFAVIRSETFRRSGKTYTVSRVIGRYATKTQAQGMADANTKSTAPTPRHLVRKLGLRIIAQ